MSAGLVVLLIIVMALFAFGLALACVSGDADDFLEEQRRER